jgi:peroxiredoxin
MEAGMSETEWVLPQERELDPDQVAQMSMEVAAISHRALRAGAIAPDFHLSDHSGHQFSLARITAGGPAVVHFNRGPWCTYFDDSLTELAAAHEHILAAGGQVVAITPPPSAVLEASARARAAQLPFTTLIDEGMRVAIAYGLTYSLPVQLRPANLDRGYEPFHNPRAGDWLVPVPATYLVHPNGTIVLSVVDVDYRNRLHCRQLIAALGGMQRRGYESGSLL